MVANFAQKLLITVSEDLIVQVSIERTIEEVKSIFQTHYFSNQDNAGNWLLDNLDKI